MKFLPFENITYETKLDSKEILKRIAEITEPKKSFTFSSLLENHGRKPYEGSLIGKQFELNRIINYKNSFLPIITGAIHNEYNKTKAIMKMRLHIFVNIFMTIWMGGLGFMLIVSLISKEYESEKVITIIFMLLFGYLLVTGCFKFESIKSKKYFAKLFEAENTQINYFIKLE